MAELLAVADAAAVSEAANKSADVVIASGATALISLKGTASGYVPRNGRAVIERKDAAGAYTGVQDLDEHFAACGVSNPGAGALTIRVRRLSGVIGVDQG